MKYLGHPGKTRRWFFVLPGPVKLAEDPPHFCQHEFTAQGEFDPEICRIRPVDTMS
jgi:hypothetical protein